jgi:LmbE family N-acetylglucosaminyl deacetylase
MWQVPLASARRILCLGAHSDDIEIGLGGTLLKLIEQRSDLEVWWIVFSAPGHRAAEAQESANDFLSGVANREIRVGSFPESYFPSEWPAIKELV